MKHAVIRGLIGLVWLAAAAVCLSRAEYMTAVAGLAAGAVYLGTAFSLWRKEGAR